MAPAGLVLLLGLPAASGAVDDQTAATSSTGDQKTQKGQPQDKQEKGKADKKDSAQDKKSEARPTPAPATPEPPALSFTDDDLQRFHKPAHEAAADEEAEAPESLAGAPPGVTPGPGPAGAAPGAPGPVAPQAPGKGTPRRPRPRPAPMATAPPADPLKGYHDKEQLEKLRNEQIQKLRDEIVQVEARLSYLQAKKGALDTPPALLEAGRTVGQEKQTAIPPATLKPGTIFPGDPHGGKIGTSRMGIFPNLPPPQTDDDKDKDAHLKPKELLEQVNQEIGTVEDQLEELKRDLVTIETRFAREKASP